VLSEAERRTLGGWARRRRIAQGLALRARIVLACADGGANIAVAARLGVNRGTVAKWRARFLRDRLDGLGDEPRPGAPHTITDAQVEEVVVRTLEEVPEGAQARPSSDIVRHALVKGGASPDDPALAGYWAQRRQKVKPPLDSYTVRLLSRQDGRCSLCGENLLTPDQLPQSPRAGNTGSCGSLRRRSRRTTWSTTTRPAPHAAPGHTSYTPPATGRSIRPGWRETPCCSRRPEPPKRLAWAACRDEWHARS